MRGKAEGSPAVAGSRPAVAGRERVKDESGQRRYPDPAAIVTQYEERES